MSKMSEIFKNIKKILNICQNDIRGVKTNRKYADILKGCQRVVKRLLEMNQKENSSLNV